MVDLLNSHPTILLGGMLIDTAHYLTPDQLLAGPPRADAAVPVAN